MLKDLSDEKLNILNELWVTPQNIHFVGIGGVGMSALAKTLIHMGHHVTGSDAKQSTYLNSLISLGAPITFNSKEPDLKNTNMVIFSSAIQSTHPEIVQANQNDIPLFHRAQLLSYILNKKAFIGIAGTHGKTTTSAMVSFLLKELGVNPTCLVGGKILNEGDNVILGLKSLFVSEIDESDGTHELFNPTHLIVTNLEKEHMDHYKSVDDLLSSFKRFINQIQPKGKLVYHYEDKNLNNIVKSLNKEALSYGLTPEADFYAQDIKFGVLESSYRLYHKKEFLSEIKLAIPGEHNILNSMAAIAMVFSLGYDDVTAISSIISKFVGTGRRLEVKYNTSELLIVDDYAHHPTEVKASLSALKHTGRKMCVVFQPHRYSRMKHFAQEFGAAFNLAESVVLMDVYSAGEASTPQGSVGVIYNAIKQEAHPDVRVLDRGSILDFLEKERKKYDLVAFLGAGDIGELANDFTEQFKL